MAVLPQIGIKMRQHLADLACSTKGLVRREPLANRLEELLSQKPDDGLRGWVGGARFLI
jgi:hypothetical protein